MLGSKCRKVATSLHLTQAQRKFSMMCSPVLGGGMVECVGLIPWDLFSSAWVTALTESEEARFCP